MRLLPVFPLLAALGCAHGFPPLELASLPSAAKYPGDDRVVLLDETRVDFLDAGGKPEARVTDHVRVRLLKSTTLPSIAARYDRTFSELVSIRGRYVLPDGSDHPLDTSKRSDTPAFDGSVLFADDRIVRVPTPLLPPGAVLEYEIVRRQLDVQPWVSRTPMGDEYPVELVRTVITAPEAWDIAWRYSSLGRALKLDPAIETRGGRKQWTFERQQVAAVRGEPHGPPVWSEVPVLSVRLERWTEKNEAKTAFQAPEALSRWLYDQYEQRAQPTPEMQAAVAEVLAGVPDDKREKARAIYEYACRMVQYCAIEIGYGGWIPHDAKSVHSLRYGDCKDKANYLRTLLKVAGIESHPTLIYAHRGWPQGFELASLGANFNHAILAVPLDGQTVYADPTWRTVPFGELPPSDIGAPVLEVTREGAPLKQTPEPGPEKNVLTTKISLALDEKGDATGTFELAARGIDAIDIKNELLGSTRKQTDFVQQKLGLWRSEVKNVTVAKGGDFATEVKLTGALLGRGLLARSAGTAALVRPSDFLWSAATVLDDEARRTPIVLRWLNTERLELELTLPAGAQVTRLPPDVSLDSEFATFKLTWRQDGGTVRVVRELVNKLRVTPVDRVEALRSFYTELQLAEATAAVVRFGGAR